MNVYVYVLKLGDSKRHYPNNDFLPKLLAFMKQGICPA